MGRRLAVIVVAAILVAIFFLFLPSHSPIGLITLPENSKEGAAMEENKAAGISALLSFSVVNQTELAINLTEDVIRHCPQYRELSFRIGNLGESSAERLFVKHSGNLKVLECRGCSVDAIGVGDTAEVIIKACKTDENTASISFSSINAEEKRIEIR